MANNIASSSQDVVGVFDQVSFKQLFPSARSIKAKVTETSAVMSHPVEDGTTVTDHKVINPIEIELSCIIATADYKAVYESIKTVFKDSTLLVVQARSGSYRSMIISAMPHDEDPEFFESLTIAIKLIEVKFAKFTQGGRVTQPKSAKHSDSKDTGKKQPTDAKAADKKQSVLYGWTK